ncbi:MAG: hypothetical protein AAF485_10220, partial [Chloroflexota bacterium]
EVMQTGQLFKQIAAESGLDHPQTQRLWQTLWQVVQQGAHSLSQLYQWLQTKRHALIEFLRQLGPTNNLSRSEWLALAMAAGLMMGQASQPFLAQAADSAGSEFQVNSYTTSYQTSASVGLDAEGDFVVVWQSANDQDGSVFGIYAQQYNASGTAQGGEFQVNSYTTGNQTRPSVGVDAEGDFVVVWESDGQDGDSGSIYAQLYNASGSTVGTEFKVNSYTTGSQSRPNVGMDRDGDFVIAWSSLGQDGNNQGIYAQLYNASGSTVGTEFKVNSYTTGSQRTPSVGMDADGNFVVAWQSDTQDGSNYGIYAQRYNVSGTAQGDEFKVNSYTTSYQTSPSIGMDAEGDFVVAWQSYTQDGSGFGIYAQRYNASGTAQGDEFKVNSYTTGTQSSPSVGMDSDGDFAVVWRSGDFTTGQDGSHGGIYAQRYNLSGSEQGSEFLVNSYTTNQQISPSVGMDSDGDFVVAWESYTQDTDNYGVYAQRYTVPKETYLPVIHKS